MKLITLAQAQDHVKSDGDDDTLLTTYCDAAESACARLANRNLYATAADYQAAADGVAVAMLAAYTAYDAALETADSQDDTRMTAMMKANAQVALDRATIAADAIVHGLALESLADGGNDILLAILMTVGHAYRNREAVITGQGAAAIEVPMSAQAIMSLHRWIGSQP